jgi:hypothetical protein
MSCLPLPYKAENFLAFVKESLFVGVDLFSCVKQFFHSFVLLEYESRVSFITYNHHTNLKTAQRSVKGLRFVCGDPAKRCMKQSSHSSRLAPSVPNSYIMVDPHHTKKDNSLTFIKVSLFRGWWPLFIGAPTELFTFREAQHKHRLGPVERVSSTRDPLPQKQFFVVTMASGLGVTVNKKSTLIW